MMPNDSAATINPIEPHNLIWLYFESALFAFKCANVSDSASGSVELVKILIAIMTIKIFTKVFDQKIPMKTINPKKEDILIHLIYSPD